MATYELVDHDGGNLVGSYTSKDAALRDVRDCLADRRSRSRVGSLALYGEHGLIAKGPQLAELAGSSAHRKTA